MLDNYSSAVTSEMRTKIKKLQNELINEKMIFSGEIYDNQEHLRCAEGDAIGDDILLERMHWLVRGVEVLD